MKLVILIMAMVVCVISFAVSIKAAVAALILFTGGLAFATLITFLQRKMG